MTIQETINVEQQVDAFLPCMGVMTEADKSLPEVEEIKGSSYFRGARYTLTDKDASGKIVDVRKVQIADRFETTEGQSNRFVDLSPEKLFCYVDYDVERDGHDIGGQAIYDENNKLIPVSYRDRCALHAFFSKMPDLTVKGFDPVKNKPNEPSETLSKKKVKGPPYNLN